MIRLLVIAGCLAGCHPPVAAPIASRSSAPGSSSCALATPRRTHATIDLVRYLGDIDGRSWVLGRSGADQVLATLGHDGTLVATKLPADRAEVEIARDGTRLWVVVAHAVGLVAGSEELYEVELASGTPVIRRAESLAAKTIIGASSFAVGSTRSLFFTLAAVGGLQLWDRTQLRPVASQPFATVNEEVPTIHCAGDRCFAIGASDSGAARRIARLRFTGDGRVTRDVLTDDPPDNVLTIADGDRTIVVYTSFARRGLFTQTVDATGRTIAGELQLTPSTVILPRVVPGDPPQVIWNERVGWRMVSLSSDRRRLDNPRDLGLDELDVSAADVRDGTFVVGFEVGEAQPGRPLPRVLAVHVPRNGPPAPAVEVGYGDRASGFVAQPLVAPGYAAVLVQARMTDDAGELVLVRAPCP